jgi:hypothetical protein
MRFWSLPGMALLLCMCLLAREGQARGWYESRGARAPKGDKVYVCHGYSCRIVTPVQLSAADLAKIAGPLKAATDAAAERRALSRSVQIFETIVGARTGTAGDLPGMQFGRPRSDQMDCIDEATNTTSLLKVLASRGHLKHHGVAEPVARGFFLDGRYPHATAVLKEKGGGKSWAVDSWPAANAEPPLIQPLSEWLRARTSAPPA